MSPKTPTRKSTSPQRGEGYEGETFKKNQPWNLRSSFNSFVAVFVALVVVLLVTSAMNSDRFLDRVSAVTAAGLTRGCDLFSGKWIYDNSTYPLYSEGKCKYMSDETACEKFGRKNLRYQNWRWQPYGCNLPRFNGTKLLERLRGKRLTIVGDSLGRNQWVSMVCLLDSVIPDDNDKSVEINGSLKSFKAKEYNASIEFYWAPLLVESNSDDVVHHRVQDRIVRANSIEKHARYWTNSDILVFDSYLWWRKDRIKVLWGSFEDEHGFNKEIEALRSYELALKTWSEWLEFHVDHHKTQLFFMSMSPAHSWLGINSNEDCYNETEPVAKDVQWGKEIDRKMMQIVEETIEDLRRRGVGMQMLNVTELSMYRKDGHPSVYRKQWEPLNEEQLANPSSYADCNHWCLPGVPDVWNEILYAYIFS